jgi:hypothetical protein
VVRKLLILIGGSLFLFIYIIAVSRPVDSNVGNSTKDGLSSYMNCPVGSTKSNNRMSREIRPGDIILVRGSTWMDKVVKTITRSHYSHVAGVVRSEEVIDIQPFTQTGYRKLDSFYGQADVFTCDVLTEDQRKKIVNYVNKEVGTSYNNWLIVWQGCRYLLNLQWPYKTDKGNLCSTLWTDAYREAGVELCPDVVFPSPRDLADSKLLQKVLSY